MTPGKILDDPLPKFSPSELTEDVIPLCRYYPENMVNNCRECSQIQALETLASRAVNRKRGGKKPGAGWLSSW